MEAYEYYEKETGKLYYKESALELELTDDYINWLEANAVKLLSLQNARTRFLEAVDGIDSNGLECGIEDVGITDRYEAMQYGFAQCKERALESIELAPD